MNIVEFVLRMKDEASAKLNAVRSSLRGAGEDGKKTIPDLGGVGNRLSEVASGFSRAREAMMKVVGMGSLIVGTFMAAYKAALPVGEYIRRMWDPVARGAHDYERMQKVVRESAAAAAQTLAEHREEVRQLESAWDRAISGVRRFFGVYRALRDAKHTALTPEEADVNVAEAQALRVKANQEAIAFAEKIYQKEKEQLANAARYPAEKTPEQMAKFSVSNGVFIKELEDLAEKLALAKEKIRRADDDLKIAVEERKHAGINEHKKRETEGLEKQRKALDESRPKAEDRLARAASEADRAWEEWRYPERRAARMAAEEEDQRAKAQFEAEKKEFIDRYGIEIWGRKTFDESRLGREARAQMTDREKSIMEVMMAQEKKSVDEAALKEIAAATKNTSEKLDQLMRLK